MDIRNQLFYMCIFIGIWSVKGYFFEEASSTTFKLEGKINQLCFTDNDCKDLFTYCLNNKCQCKNNYYQYQNKCLGLKEAKCNVSSDCLSTRLTCKGYKCDLTNESEKKKKKCHEKSGNSVCWTPSADSDEKNEVKVDNVYTGKEGSICRVYGTDDAFSVPGVVVMDASMPKCQYIWNSKYFKHDKYDVLDVDDKIEWKNNGFEMDNAVYGGTTEHGSSLTLHCRTKYGNKKYYGRLSPPNFDLCVYIFNENFHETHKFDVLVHGQ